MSLNTENRFWTVITGKHMLGEYATRREAFREMVGQAHILRQLGHPVREVEDGGCYHVHGIGYLRVGRVTPSAFDAAMRKELESEGLDPKGPTYNYTTVPQEFVI